MEKSNRRPQNGVLFPWLLSFFLFLPKSRLAPTLCTLPGLALKVLCVRIPYFAGMYIQFMVPPIASLRLGWQGHRCFQVEMYGSMEYGVNSKRGVGQGEQASEWEP